VGSDQQAAREMVKRSGQMGVPVTILADQVIVGFNQPALRNAIALLRSSQTSSPTLKLGAQVAEAERILSQQNKPIRTGVVLGRVRPDSLAARAGLQEGDIIIRLNGKAIHNIDNLLTGLQAVVSLKVENSDLAFWRDDREIEGHLPVQFS